MTETKAIQQEIKDLLNSRLLGNNVVVKKEWNPAKDATDNYNRQIQYTPLVDVAVGPFMINYVTPEEKEKFEEVNEANRALLELIIREGETFDNFRFNENPRCLIAIEIETSGSKKHLVGDITNASILGKIGLIVPTNDKNYKSFKRIMEYLDFAQRNDKVSKNLFKNIVLIKSKNLIELLKSRNPQ